jgi:hypothetical protein
MRMTSKPFIQIDRQYIISSAELRKALGLEGEIHNMSLWKGRSPNDMEKGVSADKDEWIINTTEIKPRRSE